MKIRGKEYEEPKTNNSKQETLACPPSPLPPMQFLTTLNTSQVFILPQLNQGCASTVWSLNVASSLMEATMVYYCQCNCRYLTSPLQVCNCEYDLRGFKKLLMY